MVTDQDDTETKKNKTCKYMSFCLDALTLFIQEKDSHL